MDAPQGTYIEPTLLFEAHPSFLQTSKTPSKPFLQAPIPSTSERHFSPSHTIRSILPYRHIWTKTDPLSAGSKPLSPKHSSHGWRTYSSSTSPHTSTRGICSCTRSPGHARRPTWLDRILSGSTTIAHIAPTLRDCTFADGVCLKIIGAFLVCKRGAPSRPWYVGREDGGRSDDGFQRPWGFGQLWFGPPQPICSWSAAEPFRFASFSYNNIR